MSKKIIVVVPCFNEEKRLKPEAFLQSLTQTPELHWLFVNDGSVDQTLEVLNRLKKQNPEKIYVHNLTANQGKGEAVRQGLQQALTLKADICGYFDADLATPIEELQRLVEIFLSQDKKVILGSRVFLLGRRIERKRWRFLLGRAFAFVASSMLNLKVYDTQCGAKLMACFPGLDKCLQNSFQSRWLFDVELINRLIRTGGLTSEDFYEEPLRQWTDVGGSKVKFHSFIVACWDLIKIKWL